MKRRYKVWTYESGERDGDTRSGTIVFHIGGCSVVEAKSIDDVEMQLRKDFTGGKVAGGRIYQIVPSGEGNETLRTLALDLAGTFHPCFLDRAAGFYSEFRRVRFAALAAAKNELQPEAEFQRV